MKGVGRPIMANPSLPTTNIAAPQQMTPGKIITVPGIPGHFIQVRTVHVMVLVCWIRTEVDIYYRRDPTV